MKCSFCVADEKSRNFKIIRSYRVQGCTKPESTWEWWLGECKNPDRCWGEKMRFWTVLRTKSGQWVFRTQVSELDDPKNLSNIDELRLTLQQGSGKDRLAYTGITTGRHCNSFWPLITSKRKYPVRKIIIKMTSSEPMPPNPSLKTEFDLRKGFISAYLNQ